MEFLKLESWALHIELISALLPIDLMKDIWKLRLHRRLDVETTV